MNEQATLKTQCACGCVMFVWWVKEDCRFSSPTHADCYDASRHYDARCYRCDRTWDTTLPRDRYSTAKFRKGDMVRKSKGSAWHGKIVGTYSTALTPERYAVESHFEPGSVQIYPAAALEVWEP